MSNVQRLIVLVTLTAAAGGAMAQAAGAGADFNKADRRTTEIVRIQQYDKPVRTDPLGNALLGGAVTGVVTRSAGAAALTVVGRTATEATANHVRGK